MNGSVHLGGGAAGIQIDIYDGSFKSVGVPAALLDSLVSFNTAALTATIARLYNDIQGALRIKAPSGNVTGNAVVYYNSYLPEIIVNNHSSYDLIMGDVFVENNEASAPPINITARSASASIATVFGYDVPNVTIRAIRDTDVVLSGAMDISTGELTFMLNGGSLRMAGTALDPVSSLSRV